ncbi:MAG: epoxyqueuosine reductase QueH, partial [Candidatus Omnitrophica bacterium]|nr:epoxyqueuosine reductase QueH [Candidatus Omnitrophota bacterium]
MKKKKILLHICCGICAAGTLEKLLSAGFDVTGFFYNPNIYPEDEYHKRLAGTRKVSKHFKIDLLEDVSDYKSWESLVRGYGPCEEGGKRCDMCFRLRLGKTFSIFSKHRYDLFTTTLTISPQK